jgi:hypothetical protein
MNETIAMNAITLATAVHEAYKTSQAKLASKSGLKLIIEVTEALYRELMEDVDNSYLIGNLIPSGRIQGTYAEVLGTFEEATSRTKVFLDESTECWPHQGEFFSRNITFLLRKGKFRRDPQEILDCYKTKLVEITSGNL